eukprot:437639-Rhodomonas_salina.1
MDEDMERETDEVSWARILKVRWTRILKVRWMSTGMLRSTRVGEGEGGMDHGEYMQKRWCEVGPPARSELD